MKTVKVVCAGCGCEFDKRAGDYNRTERRGARHFCSLSCEASHRNRGEIPRTEAGWAHLVPGNRRDADTPFRWFVKVAKQRREKQGDTDLTVEYLKELWTGQNGICPFTGWKMELPCSTTGWRSTVEKTRRASLDRIDCAKGYVQGNVRFVSVIANLARNHYSDGEVVEFCKAVAARGWSSTLPGSK